MIRYSLNIKGIVQGVGFRPYLFRLAKSLSLCGYVQNTTQGVYAEIEGENAACEIFIRNLKEHPPVMARIEEITVEKLPLKGDKDFIIAASGYGQKNALISPDIGICDACAAEISDVNNRRYRYAFTNCTDCGPRYTIIRDIPYDRKNTTMDEFVQCPECRPITGAFMPSPTHVLCADPPFVSIKRVSGARVILSGCLTNAYNPVELWLLRDWADTILHVMPKMRMPHQGSERIS